MRSRAKYPVLALGLLVAALVVSTTVGTQAINLGDIIKVGGVAVIVDRFGEQINDFINKTTANRDLGTTEATKVVPILSLGSGGYIGAVQVLGSQENVEKTQAVVQLEASALFGRNIRIKALIPVGSRSTSNIKRIYGVGVSAIVDIRI